MGPAANRGDRYGGWLCPNHRPCRNGGHRAGKAPQEDHWDIGDGSAAYAIQALWSAAQPQWPVTCILFKNRRYAALQDFSKVFGYRLGENAAGTALPGIDFVGLPKG
uniref:thiamine pyrophosphate-dependent enzyme n=1 Tax=Comamonas koreensis TaxID=160825 RepID=UPI0038B41324